ncbi:MAG: sugar transferase [Gemmatimonadota bacterium]|nr:sugar transferase [Gemmatimonadota bacterium]
MSSSVIRLAYVAIRRRAEARRSGGITLPDLEPGPGAEEAVAQALHDVAPTGSPVVGAAQPTAAPETHTTRQAPPQGAALIEVDTVTGAAAIPSSVTLTQRVAVARDIDSGAAVPLQLELFEAATARWRSDVAIRALNVVIAAVLLVLLSPVLLLITAAVKLTSRGPVFYKQVRVGLDRRRYRSLTPLDRRQRGERRTIRPEADGRRVRVSTVSVERRSGRDRRTGAPDRRVQQVPVEEERRRSGADRRHEHRAASDRRKRTASPRQDRRQWNLCGRMFTMYKFRTMRLDAESGTGPVWARQGDPRITPIGGFLRACRLDELPQLYNVLKGDMNIVGPRPERPTIVVDLVDAITEYPIRQRTLPGITGLAQISQAPDGSVDDVRVKVRYDLEYMRRRSVMEDLRIMAKTPMVMFFKRSGY